MDVGDYIIILSCVTLPNACRQIVKRYSGFFCVYLSMSVFPGDKVVLVITCLHFVDLFVVLQRVWNPFCSCLLLWWLFNTPFGLFKRHKCYDFIYWDNIYKVDMKRMFFPLDASSAETLVYGQNARRIESWNVRKLGNGRHIFLMKRSCLFFYAFWGGGISEIVFSDWL